MNLIRNYKALCKMLDSSNNCRFEAEQMTDTFVDRGNTNMTEKQLMTYADMLDKVARGYNMAAQSARIAANYAKKD